MTKKSNGPVPAEEMRLLIERWERLQEEKEALAADQRDVMAEAKARGFDPKTMRRMIKLRKLTVEQRREQDALDDIYKAALGMLDGTPLGNWAVERLTKPKEADAPEGEDQALYDQAKEAVVSQRKASTSWLQRTLRIGYNKAAGIIERLEREGVISAPDKVGARKVLAPPPEGQAPPVDQAPEPEEPELTIDDARRLGAEAAKKGEAVFTNPFPAFDERRAAWDEAWCAAIGSDGMEIPEALKPTPKAKPADSKPAGEE